MIDGYSTVEAHTSQRLWRYRFSPRRTYEEIKEEIGSAFHQGIEYIKLYKDFRKKNDFLEIKKKDYDPAFNEECFKRQQIRNEIEKNRKHLVSCTNNINFYKSSYEKHLAEISRLEDILRNQSQKL